MKVDVRDNQIEPALKTLKKLMLKTGLFQEMKRQSTMRNPPSSGSESRLRPGRNCARR